MAGKIGRNIPDHIYRALLARSGNNCAFPGCPRPIVNTKNIYEAQLCHIESVSHKKQRYNPKLKEAEVNGYNNLMFMCLKHHVETNDENLYTTEIMRKMKYEHEAKYVENPFHLDMSHVFAIKKECEEYWNKIEIANNNEHDLPDLRVMINSKAEYPELNEDIMQTLNLLESLIEIIDEKDKDKYWEIFNIGFPNHFNKIRIVLEHMMIKHLETYLIANPQDMETKGKLNDMRKNLLELSKTSIHID